ncbi:MAG: DUF362 domain-containing protein [Candidatus Lokiarchaeota archaeon]|nr:DUF362 domain-containing protein [Candidatus Lokiarchaeota archaeon]
MLSSNVYVYKTVGSYPRNPPFHPSNKYPEYPFQEISDKPNFVYDQFRKLLVLMKLDIENFGTKNWNPFKEIISPGDCVVIKPNLVLNHDKFQDLLTTHSSLIRVVVDFVWIALKGKGKIIIGDAPLQRCDFDDLIKRNGLKKTVDFIKSKNININLFDFRTELMTIKPFQKSKYRTIKINKKKGDPKGYSVIDLKDNSNLNLLSQNLDYLRFRVTNYDPHVMKKAHNNNSHKYLISNSVIHANVVINMPKIKSHRKAGITGCLKNNIGINGHKDWLPHHRKGALCEGGDEYIKKSTIKKVYRIIEEFEDKMIIKYPRLYKILNIPLFLILHILRKLIRLSKKDKYLEGSWFGNDTLWRTIADLNQILLYSDRKGKMSTTPQRKRFYICDGIISGQSEGPLEPSENKSNLILCGFDPVMMDLAITEILNYNYKKIPQIKEIFKIEHNRITEHFPEDLVIFSNNIHWNQKKINTIVNTIVFKPTRGWKNYIEKIQ